MIGKLEARVVDAIRHREVLHGKAFPPERLARHVAAAQRARLDPRRPERTRDPVAVLGGRREAGERDTADRGALVPLVAEVRAGREAGLIDSVILDTAFDD